MIPRIPHNDFGVLSPPALGEWEPTLTVTVVIPAHDRQDTLNLTLAALSAQSYPEHLLDVIVVDDGSATPLFLPEIAPARTKLLSSPPGGWGRAWAVQAGLDAATGEVVFVLDADMVPHRRHVEAQLRWHHLAPYVVALGWIDFTGPGALPDSEQVVAALAEGAEERLFPLSPHRHDWAEQIIHDHDGLRAAPSSLATRIHVGATVSYPAALLRAAGGMDTSLVLAEDTELGYRLTQAGAVFVPDPESRAWHVGLPTAMRDHGALKRYNDPYVADRVPYRRYLRTDAGRQWLVPYVDVTVPEGSSYEDVRATVDALLAGSLPDVRVTLTGPWDLLTPGRRSPLADPGLDLRLVHAAFEHDPRVHFSPPRTGTAPFRLSVPPGWVVAQDTVERLVAYLEEHDSGTLCVALEETEAGVTTARLDRTAALSRAALVAGPGESLDDLVDALFGLEWVDGETWGFKRRPAVYPPRRRPPSELSVLTARHEQELARYRKRVAALRAELAQARRDAGKNGRDAARWREKAEAWRREAVRLARERNRTMLKRAVRRVRNLAFPGD
ncbi:glycosyltransferase involved in cell wall biosynthesis [Nonomuraea thailandensis]|uniref:Glycosyltransferase involved in cell wall biosynthesis n=1 Tax=Nonomuraea thailandensis TaxID=1188745 RepID=A0A9X2K5S5_9ACTN|nr:glycosyltransferase family 2 protein [Nonomuraea thailandensis]MCP2361403.1 glycosyltransferase involved in cell wall biosynthesis [Nonomuraea thailandensis]